MNIEDLIKMILESPLEEGDKEYWELQEQYESKFGDILPTELIPENISDEEIKEAMKACIEEDIDILSYLGIEVDYSNLY